MGEKGDCCDKGSFSESASCDEWPIWWRVLIPGAALLVWWLNLRVHRSLKAADVVLEYQARYDELIFKVKLKVESDATKAAAYYRRFWTLQQSEFIMWRRGFIPESTFENWMSSRRREWDGYQAEDLAGVTFQEGWNQGSLRFALSDFADFMRIVFYVGATEAIETYKPRLRRAILPVVLSPKGYREAADQYACLFVPFFALATFVPLFAMLWFGVPAPEHTFLTGGTFGIWALSLVCVLGRYRLPFYAATLLFYIAQGALVLHLEYTNLPTSPWPTAGMSLFALVASVFSIYALLRAPLLVWSSFDLAWLDEKIRDWLNSIGCPSNTPIEMTASVYFHLQRYRKDKVDRKSKTLADLQAFLTYIRTKYFELTDRSLEEQDEDHARKLYETQFPPGEDRGGEGGGKS